MTTKHESIKEQPTAGGEAQALQAVLEDSDALLASALQGDESRRLRRRRIVVGSLLLGGIGVSILMIALLSGWLVFSSPPGAVAHPPADTAGETKAADPARAMAFAQEGWRLWQGGSPAAAIPKFEAAVEADPELVNAWNGLGWSRFNSGDSIAAAEAFEACVALEPKHPAALNGLGQIHLVWREYESAEKYLKKAGPQASAAWWGLSKLYLLTGEYAQAKKWIRKALVQDPGNEFLKEMMAAAKAGELDPALRDRIEGPGKPSGGTTAEGWALFNRGRWTDAEAIFRKVLEADPDDAAAHNGLGFCLLNGGEAAEAKPHFERCLELSDSAAGAMNGLARCLKEEDKPDEAIAVWLDMQERFPGVNAATVGLATTYFELEKYAEAIPYYERLVESQPRNRVYTEGLKAARAAAAGE